VIVGKEVAVWLGAGSLATRVAVFAVLGRIDGERICAWQAVKTIPRKANNNPDFIRRIGYPDRF
jgi:hypothetical protein